MVTPKQDTQLPALFEQMSDLAHQLRKAHKNDLKDLRDQAQTLTHTFDIAHPKFSALQKMLGLLRDLTNDDIKLEVLHKRAEEVFQQPENSPQTSRKHIAPNASSRPVDAWILDMFRATESAIPRETLIEQFITRYQNERHLSDHKYIAGPWLFVFKTDTAQGKTIGIQPVAGLGLHPKAFHEHCQTHLTTWEKDPFLSYVLNEGYDIDGWYALSFGGSPLFDALVDTQRQMNGEADYWLNAVYLPGDGRHESHAAFILYRNIGDVFHPEPPSGLRQDMRLLTVLGLAWRQLEHQVRALARISETDRRDMINLIAPGLMHHEIGFAMRTAYGQVYEQFHLLKRIAAETGREDVELAARYAHGIAGLTHKLYRITDAFNNLDKRAQIEDSNLQQIFEGLKILLHHRLGSTHTDLSWDESVFLTWSLRTDVVLLSQALTNLVNNALNALVEGTTPSPRQIRVYVEKSDAANLTLAMVNNGPPILPSVSRDIFKRGYTTRSQGHGQGLYLARLVAHYLGGDLFLMEENTLPDKFNVGFRLSLSRHLNADKGVACGTD
jgi:signal transduction histidine kinase